MLSKQHITAEDALHYIKEGQCLENMYIKGKLSLPREMERQLQASNCIFEELNGCCIEFLQPIKLTGCNFHKCQFSFAYFLNGGIIEDCVFEDMLDFSCGGHNKQLFSIKNCIFIGFVSFLDCIYEGPVEILNNDFRDGTNLMGNADTGFRTSFDFAPVIEHNTGKIDEDGDRNPYVNAVYVNLTKPE